MVLKTDGSPGKRSKKRYRRVQRRTPSGATVTHYVERRPKGASCARCKSALRGVARERPTKRAALPKNRRRVTRRFGGMLCHKCIFKLEKYKTRMETGFPVKRDLTIEKFLPKGWYDSLEKKFDKELKTEVEEIVSEELSPEAATEAPAKELELENLKGMGPKSLEKLKKAKVKSIKDLLGADITKLAKKTKISESKLSKWQAEAAGGGSE